MMTTNLYFTQLFIGHLKHTNLVSMWKHWCVTLILTGSWWTFESISHSISRSTYHPAPYLLPFKFCHAGVQFDKNAYPEVWKFWKNYENDIIPLPMVMFQNMSEQCQCSKWHFGCGPHRSADLIQRSRLFICVETNSWCMLSSFIASAVCWDNSAQFFSGKSMSMKQHYLHFSGRNPHHSHLPTVHMPLEDIWHSKF